MKAALLDAPAASGQGIYVRMVEIEADALTDRHLPQITSCDLPSKEYVWLPDDNPSNPYGGAFHSVAVIARREELRIQVEKEARAKKK